MPGGTDTAPIAAKGAFPFRSHRTMAQVLYDEFVRLPKDQARGRTLKAYCLSRADA